MHLHIECGFADKRVIKTGITISLSCLRIRILCDGYSYLRNDVPGKIKKKGR